MQEQPNGIASLLTRWRKGLEGLAEFREKVRALLLRAWIPLGGKTLTLAAYLRHCEVQGSPGGDEQSVVDELARNMLGALGYDQADVSYNRPLASARKRNVPDFSVRIKEFAVLAPIFVVEDKSTEIRDLQKGQRSRADEESPVRQLHRYTTSGAVNGDVGLLCNGWVIEAWRFGGGGPSRIVHLDLYGLAKHFEEQPGTALSEAHAGALHALWNRFSRRSFTEARVGKPAAPPMTPEWASQINAGIRESRQAGALVLDKFLEEGWKESAIDVSAASELLVDTIRVLIDSFADDVRHQLDDALARAEEYGSEYHREREMDDTAAQRTALALLFRRFDLAEEEFAKRCLAPVDEFCKAPRYGGISKLVARLTRDLERHVRIKSSTDVEQFSLGGVASKTIATVPKTEQEAERRDILGMLAEKVTAICTRTMSKRVAFDRLDIEYAASIRASRAFRSWVERVSSSVMVGASDDTMRSEFARQTAYVYIIRLLLVRICEDKGLFQRKLSDGGLVHWEEDSQRYLDYAAGRAYDYLTQMAYSCAEKVYLHFYGASQVFDWYQMDEKMMLRALMAFNAFNLERIDTDIIGTVYGQFLVEGKHEQGRYYTPLPLVQAMLDRVGYKGGEIIGRRIADLACGSGSFLVEACRRLLVRYQGSDGKIPTANIETAIREVQGSLFGFDINPFACYLAETNLLIQVLDLVRRAQEEGLSFTVDRFSIYCTDSLLVNEDLAISPGAAFSLEADDVLPELAKARAGDFADGFDFLVGNPPYVRADEGADRYQDYRRRIEDQDWFKTRHLKWDLYVPFVEQYHRLLADHKDACACLVTIESLATAPYAEKLRELMIRKSTVHEVLFLEKLALFADADWQDNIVVSFSRGEPSPDHKIRRIIARGKEKDGRLIVEDVDSLAQVDVPAERLFNKRPDVRLDRASTVRWDEICYVTVGMVLNSHEKLKEGTPVLVPASYDFGKYGEQLIEDLGSEGKRVRHKVFVRDDLVADMEDDLHTRRYVDSREVLRGGLGTTHWLEYGPHMRCPSRVRRPTFPELYTKPKVMFGAFTGVAVDDGAAGQFFVVPHTVRIAIRWCELEDTVNRTLTEARGALIEEKRYDPARSRSISEWYLCAIALSEPIQKWLHANKRSMKDDVYPEDIKDIPVKILTPKQQEPFIRLARERHILWAELTEIEAQGFRTGARLEIPVWDLVNRFRGEHPKMRHLTLAQVMAAGLFRVEEEGLSEDLTGARAQGARIVLGKAKRTIAEAGEEIKNKEEVARVVARVLSALPAKLSERQGMDQLPASEEGLLELSAWLDEQETGVRRRQKRIEEIGAEIDKMAWKLYRPAA